MGRLGLLRTRERWMESWLISNMAEVSKFGRMEKNMMGCGLMEGQLERVL